jgi:hypothetical protein
LVTQLRGLAANTYSERIRELIGTQILASTRQTADALARLHGKHSADGPGLNTDVSAPSAFSNGAAPSADGLTSRSSAGKHRHSGVDGSKLICTSRPSEISPYSESARARCALCVRPVWPTNDTFSQRGERRCVRLAWWSGDDARSSARPCSSGIWCAHSAFPAPCVCAWTRADACRPVKLHE